ncbi:TenA family transcriptional regulator [Nannocystis pusilla]|uniref:TenA family transcriptional regulator n=1 Tax=Nannocystis pusilla TaxID=889268 RepID=UPI003BF25773
MRLATLLQNLFSRHELIRWLQTIDTDLVDTIGAPSMAEFTFEVVAALDRRGSVRDELFASLARERPLRADEIQEVRRLCCATETGPEDADEDTAAADGDAARQTLLKHRMFAVLRGPRLSRDALKFVVGQYWHPIEYFTEFLALSLANVRELALRSRMSSILYQELGQGDPEQAHQSLYLLAAQRAGISADEVCGAEPLPETRRLLDGFRGAARSPARAVGYLYATEIVDLELVRTLGKALAGASGGQESEWLKIHARQEREHVAVARDAVASLAVGPHAVDKCAIAAWRRWHGFYDGIERVIGSGERKGHG